MCFCVRSGICTVVTSYTGNRESNFGGTVVSLRIGRQDGRPRKCKYIVVDVGDLSILFELPV